MSFQPATVTGSNGTGYAVPFSPAAMQCVITCKTTGADFWIKPVPQGSAVAAPVGSPAASGVVSGWLHLVAGDSQSLGVEQVRGLDPLAGFQVWCVTAGELDFNAH